MRSDKTHPTFAPILTLLAAGITALCLSAASREGQAAEATPSSPPPKTIAQQNGERNFYDVLEDLLADFEYDLKNGQVSGLKDLSIRNIATSENIPVSFRSHLELVVTERIMKNSKTRIVQCLPCRAKRTTVSGDQVVISSNDTNPVELSRIAKISGIEHFMDIAFSYQPAGMMLSLTISEPETGGVAWSRTYNSETSRSSAFRRGVDYTQIDEQRRASEYQPTVQYRAIAYYLFERNVGSTTGCLGFGFRMMERYDNRKKEVGFEMDYLKDASSLAGGAVTPGTINLYSGFNVTMLFVHAWNLFGGEENYNQVRGGVFAALGGTYTSGFLGGLVRAGYEWRLAKHWGVSANLGYRPNASAFVGNKSIGTVSGPEFGIGISGIF